MSLKSQKIKLTVDIPSRETGHVHHIGTHGIIIEPLGPNVWIVEVRIPDERFEGDAWYETLEVYGHEFELEPCQINVKQSVDLVARADLPAPWTGEVVSGKIPSVPKAENLNKQQK